MHVLTAGISWVVWHCLVWYLWIIPLGPLWSWQWTVSYMILWWFYMNMTTTTCTHGVVVSLLRICQRSASPIMGLRICASKYKCYCVLKKVCPVMLRSTCSSTEFKISTRCKPKSYTANLHIMEILLPPFLIQVGCPLDSWAYSATNSSGTNLL